MQTKKKCIKKNYLNYLETVSGKTTEMLKPVYSPETAPLIMMQSKIKNICPGHIWELKEFTNTLTK